MRRIFLLLVAVLLIVIVIPSTASAASWCGSPAFSKSQLLSGWKAGAPLTKGAERYVRAYSSYYHINRDQGFQSWLRQPNVKIVTTPSGYTLSSNTYCPGSSYQSYPGLLRHSHQKVAAWCSTKTSKSTKTVTINGKKYKQTTTSTTTTCRPIAKSYCRNLVKGKPFTFKHRHVTRHRIKKPPPKKCKKGYTKKNGKCVKPTPPPVVICSPGEVKNSSGVCVVVDVKCSAGQVKDSNGNCVTQTNTAEQNCKALGGTYNGSTQLCTIIQTNADCSNVTVVNGSGDVVSTTQQGNCNTTTTVVNPPPPPPVNHPPTVVLVNNPQHVYVDDYVQICALANDPDGDSLMVTWNAVRGTVSTAFRPDPSGNPGKWCTWYTAPATSGYDTVSVTVSDGVNPSVTATGAQFPNPPDDFGTRAAQQKHDQQQQQLREQMQQDLART